MPIRASIFAIVLFGLTACAAPPQGLSARTPAAPAPVGDATSLPTLQPGDPTPTDIVINPDVDIVATATPPPTLVPPVLPVPTLAAPTQPPPTRQPLPTTCAPSLTANDADNLRAGPGTDYDILDTLAQGTKAQVVARNVDSGWFEIITSAGEQGWISANYVQAQCVNSVPVVQAQPPPPPPAPTSTAAPAVPTPQPGINFWVDNPTISGGCTTVRWSVDNVQDVYFNDGSGDQGVAGHGSRVVCPSVTTTYYLHVILNNGQSVYQSLVVTVFGPPPPPPPPPLNRMINFTADSTSVVYGGCVNLQWSVTGDAVGISLDAGAINSAEPTDGSLQYCPQQTLVASLFVTWSDGSTDSRALTLQVIGPPPPPPFGPATPIPLPTAAP